jgi:hypothetical protein
MAVVSTAPVAYSGYSYRDRADRYLCELTRAHAERVRGAAGAVRYNTLRDQIRTVAFVQAELHVTR